MTETYLLPPETSGAPTVQVRLMLTPHDHIWAIDCDPKTDEQKVREDNFLEEAINTMRRTCFSGSGHTYVFRFVHLDDKGVLEEGKL